MPASAVRRLNAAIDERVGSQSFLRSALDHIFPDNWSFMLGEIAMYCFILLVASGVYLAFFFDPSDTEVIYRGSYLPLRGDSVSLAYQSTVHLSLDVRAGLLFRQIHHWAANIFIAAIVVHLLRIFLSGAFRKPREINWLVGVSLFLLSIFNGFTGYSLPGDLLSGLGLRIAYSIAQSVPIIGNWIAYLFFGGVYPSDQLTHRLWLLHVFIVPVLIAGLLGLHLAFIWRQKHTQFPGTGRTHRRIVGSQLWPTYTLRSVGLLCAVAGVLSLLGGLAQINPIWQYGPYHPYTASSFAQPDWYVGWLEGSLRLFPPWRLHLFGYQVSEVFWPAVVLPLLSFAVLYGWPWIERWWTHDLLRHNVLDRPRDRPGRTAIGVGAVAFYAVLTVAGAQDVVAAYLNVSQPPVTLTLRGMAVGLPLLSGLVAWKLCRDLRVVPKPATEAPQGAEHSASPPASRYLPDRARFEEGDGAVPAEALREKVSRAAKVAAAGASGLAVAFLAGRASSARRGNGAGRRTPVGGENVLGAGNGVGRRNAAGRGSVGGRRRR